MPNSGEKYAIAAGPAAPVPSGSATTARWYHRSPDRYAARSVRASSRGEEAAVGGELVEPLPADGAEELDRVAASGLPQIRVDLGEDVLRLRVPRPAQVAGQLAECGE